MTQRLIRLKTTPSPHGMRERKDATAAGKKNNSRKPGQAPVKLVTQTTRISTRPSHSVKTPARIARMEGMENPFDLYRFPCERLLLCSKITGVSLKDGHGIHPG